MQIVIDIPEELYNNIQKDCGIYPYRLVYDAMKNGTPLPTDAVDRVTIKEYLESFGKDTNEKEPCEDAISRQKLLKAIATLDKFGCDANSKLVRYTDHYVPYVRYHDVIDCIELAFPVTPQPKMGVWIKDKCSVCGEERAWYGQNPPYCPDCGAKMLLEVEE